MVHSDRSAVIEVLGNKTPLTYIPRFPRNLGYYKKSEMVKNSKINERINIDLDKYLFRVPLCIKLCEHNLITK